jgi:hypothetical protein
MTSQAFKESEHRVRLRSRDVLGRGDETLKHELVVTGDTEKAGCIYSLRLFRCKSTGNVELVLNAALYGADEEDLEVDELHMEAEALAKLKEVLGAGALEREVERLSDWLHKIDGGDNPCQDESKLRQWAYEALTLNKTVEEAS